MNPQNNIIAKEAHVLIHLPRFTPKSLNNCHLPTTFGSPHSLQTSHLRFPPKFFKFWHWERKRRNGFRNFCRNHIGNSSSTSWSFPSLWLWGLIPSNSVSFFHSFYKNNLVFDLLSQFRVCWSVFFLFSFCGLLICKCRWSFGFVCCWPFWDIYLELYMQFMFLLDKKKKKKKKKVLNVSFYKCLFFVLLCSCKVVVNQWRMDILWLKLMKFWFLFPFSLCSLPP